MGALSPAHGDLEISLDFVRPFVEPREPFLRFAIVKGKVLKLGVSATPGNRPQSSGEVHDAERQLVEVVRPVGFECHKMPNGMGGILVTNLGVFRGHYNQEFFVWAGIQAIKSQVFAVKSSKNSHNSVQNNG